MKSNPEKWHFSTLPRNIKWWIRNNFVFVTLFFLSKQNPDKRQSLSIFLFIEYQKSSIPIIIFIILNWLGNNKKKLKLFLIIYQRKSLEESKGSQLDVENYQPDSTKVPKSKSVATELVGDLPVLPPPPSFKSVHFAPNVNGDDSVPSIPTEGLPTGPANAKEKLDDR